MKKNTFLLWSNAWPSTFRCIRSKRRPCVFRRNRAQKSHGRRRNQAFRTETISSLFSQQCYDFENIIAKKLVAQGPILNS
jgi:hypothetical protein